MRSMLRTARGQPQRPADVAPTVDDQQSSAEAKSVSGEPKLSSAHHEKADDTGEKGDGADASSNQDVTAEQTTDQHNGDTAEAGTDPAVIEKQESTVAAQSTNESATPNGNTDDSKYPSGTKLALLTLGLAMATFVVALDNTIIATAIPRITTEFNALNDVGWYGSSYLLTTTSLQPSFGKVYAYFDVKWVYLSALIIFEVGSIICAAATGSKMLILGRAVAGAGAAALFSGGMNIVGFSVPLRRRAIYIAALSSMFGIGMIYQHPVRHEPASVVGPILGGAFTDNLTWRWCFWINLPFGGVALATVFFFFSNPPRRHTDMTTKEKLKQIDILGAFFLIGAIVSLLLALQWGGTVYSWKDSMVWGCLLSFGLLIIVFCGIQVWLGDRATMPPRILCKQRTVGACALFSAFLAMALYTHIYYLPFYFQAVKGTSAEGSGIRCIPYLVSITLSSIAVGGLITAWGPYNPPMLVGVVVFTVGAGMLHTLKVDSGTGMWIGYEILAGVGAGACVQIPFIAVQVVLEEKDMPIGNAVAIFFNTLGGSISISIAQNIFSNTLIKQLPKHAPTVDPRIIIAAGATHFRDALKPGQLEGVLVSYNLAVTTAFILPIAVGGIAALSSLLMEWKSVKGKSLIPGGGA